MQSAPHESKLPECLRPNEAAAQWRTPLDVWDLTTRLEASGVTDTVAKSEFGFASASAMAESWLPRVLTYGPPVEAVAPSRPWWREYLDGVSFSLPLLCSCLSTLWLGFSLWGGSLSDPDATGVGIGMVLSFLLSGGAVQGMVRRGLFFAGTLQPAECSATLRRWAVAGIAFAASGTALLFTASTYWDWLPNYVNVVAALFSVSLAALWLGAGALHVLKRSLDLAIINAFGIAVVACLYLGFNVPLLNAQLAAILSCNVAVFFVVSRRLLPGATGLPRIREIYSLLPFLLYGIAYYALLFGDRLAAWTASTYSAELAVQFRGDYETSVNLGLAVFILFAGWVHCETGSFYKEIVLRQRRFSIDQVDPFREDMLRYYWLRLLAFAPAALTICAVALWIAGQTSILATPNSLMIATWSIAGFAFLAIGLWNVSLLFAITQASRAALATLAACAANITIAYFASRIGGYSFAVLGFFIGGLLFAALSGAYVVKSFRSLDYHYFAAAS